MSVAVVSIAFRPRIKIVAGDPPFANVAVVDVVPPAAVIGAIVGLEVEPGAVLPVPVGEAVILLLLVFTRSVPVIPVNLALLPRIKLVAGDPPGVLVVVDVVVPPAAVKFARVRSVIEAGAVLPLPVAGAPVFFLLVFTRSVVVNPVPVNIAFLPLFKLVAGDPPSVLFVVVCVVLVPPAAVIGAPVGWGCIVG